MLTSYLFKMLKISEQCIEFLCGQAKSLNLSWYIYYAQGNKKKPLLVMTWKGLNPQLPAILLNSHMDVVPVFAEKWTHGPFSADMDNSGRIYARGSQDMKCVGMQYLAAIRQLKSEGISLQRNLHLSFVPDEETGGTLGMFEFVKSKEFKALNIGFALDEGLASPNDTYAAFYAEKSLWQIKFKISGNCGHGSLMHKNTAAEKLLHVLNYFYSWRSKECQKMSENPLIDVGDVSSINLVQIEGGVQNNVAPPLIEVSFDLRIAIDEDLKALEERLLQLGTEAGGGIEINWLTRIDAAPPTKHDDSDIYWLAFKRATQNLKVIPRVFCGGTDSAFLREIGIPAIGFSPINNTPVLLHDHDEYLAADTYLNGIDIYVNILKELANINCSLN